MKAVIQRVVKASVEIEGKMIAAIERGLLVLLGVEKGDTESDATWLAEKIVNLRIFEDGGGKMNMSVLEIGGKALVVSQFTVAGNCVKGRRPSFDSAASPGIAMLLYERFIDEIKNRNVSVEKGVFQANMQVFLINDGPVTFILESPKLSTS